MKVATGRRNIQANMSMRPREPTAKSVEAQLKELRTANFNNLNEQAQTSASGKLALSDLSETEIAVASLGIDPSSLKPIGFMNASHYSTLLKANALDDTLARRLEAYRAVSAA